MTRLRPALIFVCFLLLPSSRAGAAEDHAVEVHAVEVHGVEDIQTAERVQNTEDIVPTSFNNQSTQEVVHPPFSVGGLLFEADEDTWFKFYGFFQIRAVTGKHRDPEGEEVAGGGFNLARARVFFRAQLAPSLGALLRVGARSDGSVNVEQAYADFRFGDFTLRAGQFYLPVFQEQSISPAAELAINSSAVGSVFDGGQTQGASLLWDLGRTHLETVLSDGLRAGFSEVGSSAVADAAFTFRVEHSIGKAGFQPFSSGSSFQNESWASLLGFGTHYQSGGELRYNAVELGSLNADVSLEGHGFNAHVSSAVSVTRAEDDSRLIGGGAVGQMGYFVHDWTELYARYEALVSEVLNEEGDVEQVQFRGITGGVNYYFWPERGLRVQGDFIYYFDPSMGTPVAYNPNAGLFESSGPQWTSRVQLNLLF